MAVCTPVFAPSDKCAISLVVGRSAASGNAPPSPGTSRGRVVPHDIHSDMRSESPDMTSSLEDTPLASAIDSALRGIGGGDAGGGAVSGGLGSPGGAAGVGAGGSSTGGRAMHEMMGQVFNDVDGSIAQAMQLMNSDGKGGCGRKRLGERVSVCVCGLICAGRCV